MTNHTKRYFLMPALVAAFSLALIGCDQGGGGGDGPAKTQTTKPAATSLPEGILVDAIPGKPSPVKALKESVQQGDEVVVHVIIGGRESPIVKGIAVMTVVDAGVFNKCVTPEDHCQTPWDYCCTPKEELYANSATIQLVDEQGAPLAMDLLAANMEPLTAMVVKGKVGPRPAPGALVVNAQKIFIVKDQK